MKPHMNRCPTCNSSAPHLHPAVQFEGEVQTCADSFHLKPTPQNRPEYIEAVRQAQMAKAQEAIAARDRAELADRTCIN